MEITYYGHSCFKIKGKDGVVVFDPYDPSVGFAASTLSADIVTSSHDHPDHNAVDRVKPTARRSKPFIITAPGEYEVGGISIFGTPTFHDANGGVERGKNTVYTVFMDQIRVCHLGDLGHDLTDKQKSDIGSIDVLLVPVGGVFTINPEKAVRTINELDPRYVIPMHYRTDEHHENFSGLKTLQDFLNEYGVTKKAAPSLSVEFGRMPEETEVVVLERI